MFSFIFYAIAITLAGIGDSFLHALAFPLQLIEILPIAVMLSYFFGGFKVTLIPALILGIVDDYLHFGPITFTSIMYMGVLFIIQRLHTTVITHTNLASIFLLSLIFHAVIVTLKTVYRFTFSLLALQELIFTLFLNTIITFLAFLIIRNIQRRIEKHFI